MNRIVAIITARSGSRGIPGKNIKLLGGKPLIAWSIEAARNSTRVDRVIVSTDADPIAQMARDWGAEVPFIRPVELAADDSSHVSVMAHAIGWLKAEGKPAPDYVLLLQPTSPFRTVADIDAAADLATERHAVAVVSVCATHDHPWLAKRMLKDGSLADFAPGPEGYLRRQDLPQAYALNGAIYLNRPDVFMRDGTFLPPGTLAYVMPAERSLDLDTPWDWQVAELVMGAQHRDTVA